MAHRLLVLVLPSLVVAAPCSTQDMFAVLGVAMQPAWANCTDALRLPVSTLSELVQFKTSSQLTQLCAAPTCVANIDDVYKNMPNCVTSDGLNLHDATERTSQIICGTLPASLTTNDGSACSSVDRTLISFLMGQKPVPSACLEALGGNATTLTAILPSTQADRVCALPACTSFIKATYKQLPQCVLPDGSKPKDMIEAALSTVCHTTPQSVARPAFLCVVTLLFALLVHA
ncbi:hypothetical protein SDRG_08327 [Saprolegnia diclina VS20]|uniref:Uncharacterized protein n=1 Tax=Saprolegnia diclina (strain VS20) TaxID=1156394 RepID=T0RNY7_SAPDV|nr:hypothetical protein SDRG_08327 [Saprolegnia diclina VS20]EQC34118.1 hypothetical protein SDRG_08327 [Saprolegnia diclina VS20]|eukprot:XP_008612430.1 hypothetical protein SDRG_08327 [Saprolegnia diclina VS20]